MLNSIIMTWWRRRILLIFFIQLLKHGNPIRVPKNWYFLIFRFNLSWIIGVRRRKVFLFFLYLLNKGMFYAIQIKFLLWFIFLVIHLHFLSLIFYPASICINTRRKIVWKFCVFIYMMRVIVKTFNLCHLFN